MGIRKFLEAEDKDFISLHDLLKELETQQNVSYQEAAMFLYRLRDIFPTWYSFTVEGGKEAIFNNFYAPAIHYLSAAANGANHADYKNHRAPVVKERLFAAENYGFSRKEIKALLEKRGIAIN